MPVESTPSILGGIAVRSRIASPAPEVCHDDQRRTPGNTAIQGVCRARGRNEFATGIDTERGWR